MPVKIMVTNRGAGPVVVCDFCGKIIESGDDGNYEWDDDGKKPGDLVDVYFVHRKCVRQNQAKLDQILDSSMPITVLLPYLIHNLKVDMDYANSAAQAMSNEIE